MLYNALSLQIYVMYVCVYLCLSVSMRVCACVCLCVRAHVYHMDLHTCACLHMCVVDSDYHNFKTVVKEYLDISKGRGKEMCLLPNGGWSILLIFPIMHLVCLLVPRARRRRLGSGAGSETV